MFRCYFIQQLFFAYFLLILQPLVDLRVSEHEMDWVSGGGPGPCSNLILHFLWARPHSGGQVTKQLEPADGVRAFSLDQTRHNKICLPCSRNARPTAVCMNVCSCVSLTMQRLTLQLQFRTKFVCACVQIVSSLMSYLTPESLCFSLCVSRLQWSHLLCKVTL